MAVLAIGAAAITLLPTATHAQQIVWGTNFDNEPLGSYGAVSGNANLAANIVTPGEAGGDQALELTCDPDSTTYINCFATLPAYTASGNTNTVRANYTLDFDMQINGKTPGFAMQLYLYIPGNGSVYGGQAMYIVMPTADIPVAGSGWHHLSYNLSGFSALGGGYPPMTSSTYQCQILLIQYNSGITQIGEAIDVDNLYLKMITNSVAPPPHPKMTMLPAKPGLRIFQKASDATYTQEGMATVDLNQSWVGATPSAPRSYAITFADFDTVANYTMNVQLCPGGNPDSPYSVYFGANDLLWTITSGGGASGFTTAVAFKTNSPSNANGAETNVLLAAMSTTSTNGRGTWTLTFTTDTNGTVRAPDGTSGSFVMDPAAAAQFADPLTVFFGTTAGATGGYGQFTDISGILITNVAGFNENDNFTKDDVLDTTVWDPGFSRDAGSIILVSSNTPSYWVNWPIPDDGYGLEIKASLNSGTNVWFSPNYYGSGIGATNTGPSLMGTSLNWTWIPSACLPTVDGTVGGTPSKTGFFRLSNPAPTQ